MILSRFDFCCHILCYWHSYFYRLLFALLFPVAVYPKDCVQIADMICARDRCPECGHAIIRSNQGEE
jgi:hypothetical protein